MNAQLRRALTVLIMTSLGCTTVTSLFSGSTDEADLTLIVNEVMPAAAQGDPAWVELTNIGRRPAPLAGRALSDLDGNTFVFPAGTPDLPRGDFALVLFDGQGEASDEPSLEAGRLVVHTPADLVDPFEPEGDQLGLFEGPELTAETLLHFVAWGRPAGEDESPAVEAGRWNVGAHVNAEPGGEITGASPPGVSLGVYPEREPEHLDSWVVYRPEEATPGEPNALPGPNVLIPGAGAEILRQDVRLAWYSVPFTAEYQFQLARSQEFQDPEVDLTLQDAIFAPQSPPPPGVYFWRVRARAESGDWSEYTEPTEVTILDAEDLSLPVPPEEGDNPFASVQSSPRRANLAPERANQASFWEVDYLNGLRPLLQRKDSDMICWDGDDESGARRPWDHAHADTPGNHSRHGRNYCARASVAMINHFYGGDLSQDRITYEHFGGDGWPVLDLGHDKPLSIAAGRDLLSWSLNGAGVTLTMGKPTFQQIQAWAREGRAVMVGIPGHAIVLRGWAIYNGSSPSIPAGTQFVIYNDPWDGRMHLQTYASLQLTNTRAPAGAPGGRMEEASVRQDDDGDGIVNFDEIERFRTDPAKVDTDDDCVPDLQDMHSFIYTRHNQYSPSVADKDGDGLWAQQDPDNDGGGTIDGNEDHNFNGHLDAGETNNYDGSDDRAGGPCSPAAQPVSTPTQPMTVPDPTATPTQAPTEPPPPTPIPADGLYSVTIMVFSDPDGHAPFVAMPPGLDLTVESGSIRISGPAPWVDVEGDLAEDGSFEASGVGTVAGFPGVSVSFNGRVGEGQLEGRYRMGVGGELPGGRPIEFEVAGDRQAPAGEDGATSSTELDAFVASFNRAFEEQDASSLFDLLHPAVLERYGASACEAYLAAVVEQPTALEVHSLEGPEPWTWVMDGRSASFEEAYSAQVTLTSAGGTQQQTMHLVPVDDGSLAWFTDCGDPQP